MKRILALLVLFFSLGQVALKANPVDAKQALSLAQKFFAVKNGFRSSANDFKIVYAEPNTKKDVSELRTAGINPVRVADNLYYIINKGQKEGYVIISGDDRVIDVLAYAEEGEITPERIQINSNLKFMLEEYAIQMEWALKNLPESDNKFRAGGANPASVVQAFEPLLRFWPDRRTRLRTAISYGQAWPFNDLCPNVRRGNSLEPTVSGCVATAIAMNMAWHRWPEQPTGTVSYTWNGQTLSSNLNNSPYNWNIMPKGITSGGVNRETGRKVTSAEVDQIGRLLRDVGYATRMGYNSASVGGSGTMVYEIVRPFSRNFGYKNTVKWIQKKDYNSRSWWGHITDELKNYGPIIYAGYSQGGGHCFIFDSYGTYNNQGRSVNFVHVDWGWTGKENGWYAVDILEPGSQGIGGGSGAYNRMHQMLRYVSPNRRNNPNPNPNPNPEPRPEPVKPFVLQRVEGSEVQNIEVELGDKKYIKVELKNAGTGDFDAKLTAYLTPAGDNPFKTYFVGHPDHKAFIAAGKSKIIDFELDLNKDKFSEGVTYDIHVAHEVANADYNKYIRIPGTNNVQKFGQVKVKKKAWPNPNPNPRPEPEPEPGPKPEPEPGPNPDPNPRPNPNPNPRPEPDYDEGYSLSVTRGETKTYLPERDIEIVVRITNKGDETYNRRIALCMVKSGSTPTAENIISTSSLFLSPNRYSNVKFSYIDFTNYAEGDYNLYVAYRTEDLKWAVIDDCAKFITIKKKERKEDVKPVVKKAKLYLSREMDAVSAEEGKRFPIISVWIANSGDKNYNGDIVLFASKDGTKREYKVVSGRIELNAGMETKVKFHPYTRYSDRLTEGKYTLYVRYYDENGSPVYLNKEPGGTKNWEESPVGFLEVFKPKDDNKPEEKPAYSRGVRIEKVQFFQDNEYRGGNMAKLFYKRGYGKFAARIFLRAEEDFLGYIRVGISEYNKELNPLSHKFIRKTIKMSKGQLGKTVVNYGLDNLIYNYYKLVVQYWDPNAKQWLTYQNTGVPFYVNFGRYYDFFDYDMDMTPTRGITVKALEITTKDVGDLSKREEDNAEEVDNSNEEKTPVEELNAGTIKVYPTISSSFVNVDSDQPVELKVYDMSGRIVLRQGVNAGTSKISISELPSGSYLLRANNKTFRLIRK